MWGDGFSCSKKFLCNALLYPEATRVFSEPRLDQSLESSFESGWVGWDF